MWEDLDGRAFGLAVEGALFQAYNEEAFRYLLGIERNRVERSHRSSLLVLVNLKKHPDRSAHLTPGVAAKIFAGLSLGVREVDFVGWYRENRIAGAVLAQGPEMPGPDVSRRIGQRITELVGEQLPVRVSDRLRVRLVHLRPTLKSPKS
jgi:hypothetical protein